MACFSGYVIGRLEFLDKQSQTKIAIDYSRGFFFLESRVMCKVYSNVMRFGSPSLTRGLQGALGSDSA